MDLVTRIEDHEAEVAVIGLGYVGLPLALAFAGAGYRVVGVDNDLRKVSTLNAGQSYIGDVSSETVGRFVGAPLEGTGSFHASADYAALAASDVVFICVPTPFDEYKTPDLSFIRAASRSLSPFLKRGQLVILQSTTYPGTTEEIVQPILEESGLKAGLDFYLAFSPERIDPGNPHWHYDNTPKVVGGLTPESTRVAASLLSKVNPDVHTVSSTRVAEMCKLLENIFRSVNIALVNELALLTERMGIDIWEVIEAARTKPFGFLPFYPGPGVGGHCIPVDPYYLSWKAREFDFYTKFIELAAETNQRMPYHTVERTAQALSRRGMGLRGARVMLIGASFKPDVEDARNSPAERVAELLLARGAELCYHDPYVECFDIRPNAFFKGHRLLASMPLSPETLAAHDCVVILVKHRSVDYQLVLEHAPLIVDTVNALGDQPDAAEKLVRLGVG
jgi:UDP-N-acetyl-D-glucosamine dehydrogenase